MSGNENGELPQEVPILHVATGRVSARAVATCRLPYSGGANHSRLRNDDTGKDFMDTDLQSDLVLRLQGGGDGEHSGPAEAEASTRPPKDGLKSQRDAQGRFVRHVEDVPPELAVDSVRSPPGPARVLGERRKAVVRIERLAERVSSLGREEFFSPRRIDAGGLPGPEVFFSPVQTDGETAESDASLTAEGRKRQRSSGSDTGASQSGEASDLAERRKSASGPSKRGRGRLPTTTRHAGLAKEKAELLELEQQERELQAEEDLRAASKKVTLRRLARRPESFGTTSGSDDEENRTALALNQQVRDSLGLIKEVASKSKNLKGTYQRVLKEAVVAIREAVGELRGRTVSDETRRLAAENARLKAEMAELRKEMGDLRASLGQRREGTRQETATSPAREQGDLERNIVAKVSAMMGARLSALEERLLPQQPTQASTGPTPSKAGSSPRGRTPAPTNPPGAKRTAKKKKKKEGLKKPPTSDPGPASQVQQPRSASEEGWTTVVKRGKKNKKKTAAGAATTATAQKPAAPRKAQGGKDRNKDKAKLRVPRSAAVVLTLQMGAEERGVTYKTVIREAKSKISLDGLGINGLRFRRAVTGAAILEIPGPATTSGDKADSLAAKLRETLNEADVRIARPVKCAEMRISGLDDSVSEDELAAAVAKGGGCALEAVSVGRISRTPTGLGTAWVRCPVAVAKKVAEGRLLVGWASANVKLLESRPLRCYRCLLPGHVRKGCTSEIDRSDQCYRCGKSGHLARDCTAAPRCTLCAAASKPADHSAGSSTCTTGAKAPKRVFRKESGKPDTPGASKPPAVEEGPINNTPK
ncbi:uncharacterized protein LOC133521017 [Cydia pomonella]|uniref:uncharacterized protein LOC133521017 n=1 Tax=Cydia pomonella TaxID=82600 RepID=UPI002ADD791E|nr:uncharacterized protein LOC133521017 [Cydia pomonella]